MVAASQPDANGSRLRTRLLRSGAVLTVVLGFVYAAMVGLAGRTNILPVLSQIDPALLLLPFITTLLSYLTMSLSYEGILRAAGASIRSRDMLRITFIANTANYVLPSGGLTGFALRLVFFTRRGITAGRAIAISFTQTLLTNLTLLVLVVYGLLRLMAVRSIDGISLGAALGVTGFLVAALMVCLGMIYLPNWRGKVLRLLDAVTHKILILIGHEERFGARAGRLYEHIGDGMDLVAEQSTQMIIPTIWIFLDWIFMLATLYLGFYATGYPISFSAVTIAFSVSIILAIISFVPGGAGVLEGALAATFLGLGVPLSESLVPIFLYRVAYFVFPGIVSLVVLRGAFREVDDRETEMAEELL